jgi:DNA transformation protein
MKCPGCGAEHTGPHDVDDDVAQLRNLGPASAEWLSQAGITTFAELKQAGAAQAFLRVQRLGVKPSLNLLYAIEGAISGLHWLEVKRQHKPELLTMLDSAREAGET